MHRSNDKIQTAEGSLIKSLPQERFLWRCYPLLASNKLTVVQSSQHWRLCHKISLHKIKRQVQTTERQQECFSLLLASLQWRNDSSVQQQEVSVVGVHPALPYARGKGSPACPEPSGTQLGQLSSIQTAFLGCFGTHIPEEVDHRPRVCALHNSAARHNHIGTCLEDIKHPLSHTEQSHCLQLACKHWRRLWILGWCANKWDTRDTPLTTTPSQVQKTQLFPKYIISSSHCFYLHWHKRNKLL